MRTPSPPYCRLDLAPPLADRFIAGWPPSIAARYFSSCPSDSTSRWTPCPPENNRFLPGQRGITPAFGYGAPHPSARGTLTLLNNVLLSTHYGRSDSYSLRRRSARAFPSGRPFGSPRAGLPDSRLQPYGHSVSNHLRKLRLAKARYLSAGRTKRASPWGDLGASPFASRLATPRRPNRVRYPTD